MLSRNLILGLLSLGLSYLLTPITVPLCRAVGAIDRPDGVRKINTEPTPRLGGLGFFFASLIVLFPYIAESPTVAALLSGGAILVAGGIADDTFTLTPRAKLLIQAAAALVSIAFIGMPDEFSFLGVLRIPLSGIVGFIFVLFRIVFTVNAVNFSDGLDGLASGLSIIALLSLSIFGAVNLNTVPSLAALVIAFSVMGFMPYNKYRAKIFMGDCGSQFLGLSIAILSLGNAPGGNFTLETALFLAVPSIDTTVSVIRRIAKGKSPFVADKGHLHHVLLSLGVAHPHAAELLVVFSGLIALVTLLFVI